MFKVFLLVVLVVNSFGGELPYSQKALHNVRMIVADNDRITEIVKDLDNLNYKQLSTLGDVFQTCKRYDLEYTCIAISYKESKLGKYLFNTLTGDYGIMGINLKTFVIGNKIKMNYWGKREMASKLIVNNDLNIALAVENLLYWKKVTNKDWLVIWGSYNGGWKPNVRYASEILNTIKAFKIYFKKHKDVYKLIEK